MDSNSQGSPYALFEDMEEWCTERETLRACAKAFTAIPEVAPVQE